MRWPLPALGALIGAVAIAGCSSGIWASHESAASLAPIPASAYRSSSPAGQGEPSPTSAASATLTPSSTATPSSSETNWYTTGQAAAIRAASTPDFNDGGNSGAPGGIAQNAQQWCTDLMFNQQPTDLRDYLQSRLPPSSDPQALQEWVAGCESEVPAGLGNVIPTAEASTSPSLYCKLDVTWQNGAYLVIVESLSTALQSCRDQAAELASNSGGTFTVTVVAQLNTVPSGWCSLDGVTLTYASATPGVGCSALEQNINWLMTP